MEGSAYGIEAWSTWQAMPSWRLSAGGVLLKQHLRLRPGSTDPTGVSAAGNDPTAQWTLRSSLDLPRDTSLDVDVRHVGALPAPRVPAYTAVNVRLAWRVRPNVELSVVGENVFDRGHVEFGSPASASVIPRAVFFKVTCAL